MFKNTILVLSVTSILIIFLAFNANKTSSKSSLNGYTLNISAENVKEPIKIKMSYFSGSASYKKEIKTISLTTDKPQGLFSFNTKILGAIYRLEIVDNPKDYIDIVLENGSNISLSINGNTFSSVKVIDALNADFVKLQNQNWQIEARKEYLSNLISTYPKSVLALYSSLELRQMDAKMAVSNHTGIEFENEYFSNIDLTDSRIPFLPNSYSFLFSYIKLNNITDSIYSKKIDRILTGMDCDSKNYQFYLDWIFKNINYYQQYNLNKSFEYAFNTYLNKEKCIENDKVFYNKILAQYSTLNDIRIGSTIPYFEMSDVQGKNYNIKAILQQSDYTCLVFYDQDCQHCKELMPQMAGYFESKSLPKNKVQLIAFRNNENTLNWEKFISNSKLQDWLNVAPYNGDEKYRDDLKTYSNPQVYLLDRSGKVLALRFDSTHFDNILRK